MASGEYRKSVTEGSILYPMIALWAALFGFADVYEDVAQFKAEQLAHCNFQFWYLDETSEANLYTNGNSHGATLSHVGVDRPTTEFIEQAFAECDHLPHFKELSPVKSGLWPIVLVACRHYRLPIPLDFFRPRDRRAMSERNASAAPLPAGE